MAEDQGNTEDKQRFSSSLEHGRQRFLAHAIEHALEVGRRTPQDFIRHFPPSTTMEGLARQAGLRANILVLTTGLKKKIASKKSWQSAAEDLQIALDEGETDAESIVAVFDPDDRVRYLDNQKLWEFLIEGEFWKTKANEKERYAAAKEHVAFMLERALIDKLITHKDVVEGISVGELAARLPKAELGKIIESALAKNGSFTEGDLLGAMPPFVLVEYVPLPHIWNTVVVPKVAERHEYLVPAKEAKEGAKAEEAPGSEAPASEHDGQQEWVDVGTNESLPPPDDEDGSDDEISEEDFAL